MRFGFYKAPLENVFCHPLSLFKGRSFCHKVYIVPKLTELVRKLIHVDQISERIGRKILFTVFFSYLMWLKLYVFFKTIASKYVYIVKALDIYFQKLCSRVVDIYLFKPGSYVYK